jgi:hypothetical protein
MSDGTRRLEGRGGIRVQAGTTRVPTHAMPALQTPEARRVTRRGHDDR